MGPLLLRYLEVIIIILILIFKTNVILIGRDVSLLYSQLRCFFEEVTVAKPKSSRNSSIESFVVCRRFFLPEGFQPSMDRLLLDHHYGAGNELLGPSSLVVPFVACGDLSGFDPDKSYPLDLDDGVQYVYRDPVQPPIKPNYHTALQMKNDNI